MCLSSDDFLQIYDDNLYVNVLKNDVDGKQTYYGGFYANFASKGKNQQTIYYFMLSLRTDSSSPMECF